MTVLRCGGRGEVRCLWWDAVTVMWCDKCDVVQWLWWGAMTVMWCDDCDEVQWLWWGVMTVMRCDDCGEVSNFNVIKGSFTTASRFSIKNTLIYFWYLNNHVRNGYILYTAAHQVTSWLFAVCLYKSLARCRTLVIYYAYRNAWGTGID